MRSWLANIPMVLSAHLGTLGYVNQDLKAIDTVVSSYTWRGASRAREAAPSQNCCAKS